MDDMQNKISQIMSDPEAMKQVQSLGKMLGLAQNEDSNESSPIKNIPQNEHQNNGIASLLGDDTFSSFAKIMPLLQSVKQEDETTHLLLALRPFLSDSKRKRLDDAKKMLQLLKILPLLKGNGLF